jgi:hypothetical protein
MAANLLIRHNTQRAILVDAFKQVQVLVSDESVQVTKVKEKSCRSQLSLVDVRKSSEAGGAVACVE